MPNPLVVVNKMAYQGEEGTFGVALWLWCPGCKQAHRPQAVDPETGTAPKHGPTWEWNGRTDEGFAISPSLLVYTSVHLCEGEHPPRVCPNPDSCGESGHLILNDDASPHTIDQPEPTQRVLGHDTPHTREPAFGSCHSFITNGTWNFLDDCAHSLRGHHPLVPLPDWIAEWGN